MQSNNNRDSRRQLSGIYRKMLDRCHNTEDKNYFKYGARGITVCDRWRSGEGGLSGLDCFIADMGKRPTPDHSIDRIDNDGNYEPSNCRWATQLQQAHNRRINSRNKSGVEGVWWDAKLERWKVTLWVRGVKVFARSYKNKDDAIAARKAGELKYYKPVLDELEKDKTIGRLPRGEWPTRRSYSGAGNPRARLTEEQARQILASKGLKTATALAEEFGVNRTTIARIQKGKLWAELQSQLPKKERTE